MKSRGFVGFGAAVAALLLATVAGAQGPVPVRGWALHHDTSPPLREIAITATAPTGFAAEVPIRIRPGTDRRTLPATVEPDGGLQTKRMPLVPIETTPSVDLSFQGLSEDDNAAVVGARIVPPDVNGDIGLDDQGNKIYIQYINLIWAIYDATNGDRLAGPFAGNSFWQGFGGPCDANNDGDPVVLYDDQAGRWFFSQFSISEGVQCVAVSTTSDPLGSYHRYAFTVTPGGQNDYPKLGVWDDGTIGSAGQSAYTFTLRDFGGAGGSFSVSAGVLERDAILNGSAAQFVKFSNPCTGADCIEGQLPPHQAGPPPPAGTCPTFWAAVDSAYDDSPFAGDGYRNHTLCVNWANTSASTYSEGPMVTAGSNFDRFLGNGFSDCISPVNGGEVLDCLAAFTMFRAQYRWYGSEASVLLNTTVDAGNDRAGIRWAETVSSDGDSSWQLAQDGTYAPDDGIERWMGAIAQDQDRNIALGYSGASATLFPSLGYTTRTAGDPAGTMPGGEMVCHQGTGAQRSSFNRWGDYYSMSVDPVDDCTFWFTGEYYETTTSFDFKTRICSFRFPNCGTTCVPSTEICGDGIDNDCDGQVDCDDGDCASDPVCQVTAVCGDGICEYPDEDQVSCAADCVTGGGAACGNGVCEVADGEDCFSCPQDCASRLRGQPSRQYCCGEPDCSGAGCNSGEFQCTTDPGGMTAVCGDGICDPFLEDALQCASDCGGCDAVETNCTDGLDNDCDGLVDEADSDCVVGCPDVGFPCAQDSDCCSNKCRGPRSGKTCKAL